MLLLSKFFPRFFKSDKDKRTRADSDMPCTGDKPKGCTCQILLLDDTQISTEVKSQTKGQVLLNHVYEHLNLLERDYFGLRYLDGTNQTHWLDPSKSVGSQLKTTPPHTFYFGVKFYAADPCKLQEEITRYQFFLQVKRDILQGRLPVSFDMAADLSALAVQSELGDYDLKRHSLGYVSEFRFVPNQTEELENRIEQLHKSLLGQVPAVAEYKFLDRAKWLDMYGVDLHPVQGEGNQEYFLGLTPTGVVVYKNKSKVGNYFWPRITKVTFKDKRFMIRVKDKNNDENTYAFDLSTKQACKHLWKCCVEHHAFFRLNQARENGTVGKLFSLGSKHRYSGRTAKQVLLDAANRHPPHVIRTPSKRHQRRHSADSLPAALNLTSPTLSEGPVTQVVTPEPVKTPSSQRQSNYGSYTAVPDSPRSTKSAPWESGHHIKGGLYTTGRDSPLSVRSEKLKFPAPRRIQSGSESESGYSRRRGRGAVTESGSESECSQRWGNNRRYRKSAEELPRHTMNGHIYQNNGQGYGENKELRPNGSLTSMNSEASAAAAARRRRRRSRSPGKKPPEELAQHFKYIDPAAAGMSEEQMRDIPYTKVETQAEPPRFKHSPHSRHRENRHKSPSRRRPPTGDGSDWGSTPRLPSDEPPPPYPGPSPNPYSGRPPQPPYRSDRRTPSHEGVVHPPPSVHRNETHTAPIVKTKPMPHSQSAHATLQGYSSNVDTGATDMVYQHQQNYSNSQVPQQHYGSSQVPQQQYGSSQVPQQHYSSSHVPQQHYSSSQIPQQHYSSGQVPQHYNNSQLAPRHMRDDSGLCADHDPYSNSPTLSNEHMQRLMAGGGMYSREPVINYKVINKPMYIEQASSEPHPSSHGSTPLRKYPPGRSPRDIEGTTVLNSSVNTEILTQVLRSPGSNKDMMTEL